MTEFTYEEWHLLWRAVEARATHYWSFVERFQIETKQKDNDQTELWIHFLELAEQQNQLLDKIEVVANEHFPIVQETLFPARCIESQLSREKSEDVARESESENKKIK